METDSNSSHYREIRMEDDNGNDDCRLTMESVELTVSGCIYVKDPAGSYPIEPELPLALGELLKSALDECGLSDRIEDVYMACCKAAEPQFAKRISELEAIRERVLSKE